MTTTALDGPFMTALQLTDYRDQPGYALSPEVSPGSPGSVAWTLARLERKAR